MASIAGSTSWLAIEYNAHTWNSSSWTPTLQNKNVSRAPATRSRVNSCHTKNFVGAPAHFSWRAGGNERHLLFYARYEETWPHPTPPMCAHVTLPLCVHVTLESGRCARVTPACVRGWLWVEKVAIIAPVCTCDSKVCARMTPWPIYMAEFLWKFLQEMYLP